MARMGCTHIINVFISLYPFPFAATPVLILIFEITRYSIISTWVQRAADVDVQRRSELISEVGNSDMCDEIKEYPKHSLHGLYPTVSQVLTQSNQSTVYPNPKQGTVNQPTFNPLYSRTSFMRE
jgi:hypothetical protein